MARFWQAAVPVPLAAVVTGEAVQSTVPGAGLAAVVETRVNFTVPVSKAVPAVYVGFTVAVNATCWFVDDGLGEEARATAVEPAVTDCDTTLEAGLLPKLLVSELVNFAVSEWVPDEENGTAQAGTIPPVNAEFPLLGNVQSTVPPSE